nr:hypothetical protein CFP56_63794 [Quercus suber]
MQEDAPSSPRSPAGFRNMRIWLRPAKGPRMMKQQQRDRLVYIPSSPSTWRPDRSWIDPLSHSRLTSLQILPPLSISPNATPSLDLSQPELDWPVHRLASAFVHCCYSLQYARVPESMLSPAAHSLRSNVYSSCSA